MSGDNKKVDINSSSFVPVSPAQKYKVPYVADPIEFMVYGDRSLEAFSTEVKKVEAELRREIYHAPETDYQEQPNEVKQKKIKDKKISSSSRRQIKEYTGQRVKPEVNLNSVFSIIMGIVIIAILAVGMWIQPIQMPTLFTIIDGNSGITYIMGTVEGLSLGSLVWYDYVNAAAILLIAFISLVLIISSFIKIRGYTGAFTKMLNLLRFALAALILITQLAINIGISNIDLGLWLIIAITAVSLAVSLFGKSRPKATEE